MAVVIDFPISNTLGEGKLSQYETDYCSSCGSVVFIAPNLSAKPVFLFCDDECENNFKVDNGITVDWNLVSVMN